MIFSKKPLFFFAFSTILVLEKPACGAVNTDPEVSKTSGMTTQPIPLVPMTVLCGNPEEGDPLVSPNGKYFSRLAQQNKLDPKNNGNRLTIWLKTLGQNDDKPLIEGLTRGIWHYYWVDDRHILYLQDLSGREENHVWVLDVETKQTRDVTPWLGCKAEICGFSYPVPGVRTSISGIDRNHPGKALITVYPKGSRFSDVYLLDLNISQEPLEIVKNPGNDSYLLDLHITLLKALKIVNNTVNTEKIKSDNKYNGIVAWIPDTNLEIRGGVRTNEDGSQDLLIKDDKAEGGWRSILHVNFEDTLKDELYSGVLGFSKDGNWIYLNCSVGVNTKSLSKINIHTKAMEVLAQDPNYDVTRVLINPDTYEPDAVAWQKEKMEWQVLNPALEEDFKNILGNVQGGGRLTEIELCTKDKWTLAFTHDNRSDAYYMYDLTTKKLEFLFNQRPQLNNYKLAKMRPVQLKSRDGLDLHGYLTLPNSLEPADITCKLPLVLLVHGGPFWRDSWGYSRDVQFLANRGYAVLQINYRGSTGYGKEFLNKANGEWGREMQYDLIDGVNWAINQGFADPNRVAIFGGSFGGYAALLGLTQTPDLFCCAVDLCGVSNLRSFINTMPSYWSKAQWGKRIGSLTDEEFLQSRSPLFSVDKIKKPLLVIQGANDPRVKKEESDQIVTAMRKRGLDCEYYLFLNEGHGLYLPENRLVAYEAIEKFLGKYLGGRCQNSELSIQQYAISLHSTLDTTTNS